MFGFGARAQLIIGAMCHIPRAVSSRERNAWESRSGGCVEQRARAGANANIEIFWF